MLYAIICNDRPNSLQLRMDTRPTHLDYLSGLGEAVKLAGPFLDGEGKPNGSLVVVEAESLVQARQMAESDPYAKAGLFAVTDVRPWNWVIKNPANA